jgi:hypothetical protein
MDNLPHSRRPHKLSKSQQRHFSSVVRNHHAATGKDLVVFMQQKLHMKILPQTAQQERKWLGYRPQTKKQWPKLMVADLTCHLKWCWKR